MTWITDQDGRRWVDQPVRKRRKSPRAMRFAYLKVGDVLTHSSKCVSMRYERTDRPEGVIFANDDHTEVYTTQFAVGFAICEDRWFDPVAGQDDPVKGEMASVRPLSATGRSPYKQGHTLRGLASQGFNYATPEQAALVLAFFADRDALIAAWRAGQITDTEFRAKAKPFIALLRECGLEPPEPVIERRS